MQPTAQACNSPNGPAKPGTPQGTVGDHRVRLECCLGVWSSPRTIIFSSGAAGTSLLAVQYSVISLDLAQPRDVTEILRDIGRLTGGVEVPAAPELKSMVHGDDHTPKQHSHPIRRSCIVSNAAQAQIVTKLILFFILHPAPGSTLGSGGTASLCMECSHGSKKHEGQAHGAWRHALYSEPTVS